MFVRMATFRKLNFKLAALICKKRRNVCLYTLALESSIPPYSSKIPSLEITLGLRKLLFCSLSIAGFYSKKSYCNVLFS